MENELDRIKRVYAERDKRPDYVPNTSAGIFFKNVRFAQHEKENVLFSLMCRHFIPTYIKHSTVLDIGCGDGNVLADFVRYGFLESNCHGVDLVQNRIWMAKDKLPRARFMCLNAEKLPYSDGSFVVVLMFTLLSSILDDKVRANIIKEAKRIMLPRGGMIILSDYRRLIQHSPDEKVFSIKDVKAAFPESEGYRVEYETYHPTYNVLKRVVWYSWIAAKILQNLNILNTHYIALITKK